MHLAAQPGAAASADRFTATCTASEAVGDFVRMTGGGLAATVDIDAAAIQRAIGIIISKPTATSCVVQRSGTVTLASLSIGALYFVGTTGKASLIPPLPSTGKRTIQPVGTARTPTLLDLHISPNVFRVLP